MGRLTRSFNFNADSTDMWTALAPARREPVQFLECSAWICRDVKNTGTKARIDRLISFERKANNYSSLNASIGCSLDALKAGT